MAFQSGNAFLLPSSVAPAVRGPAIEPVAGTLAPAATGAGSIEQTSVNLAGLLVIGGTMLAAAKSNRRRSSEGTRRLRDGKIGRGNLVACHVSMAHFSEQGKNITLELNLQGMVEGLPLRLLLVPLQPSEVGRDGMKGYRRYLAGVKTTEFCHVAFSMNAQLRNDMDLRDIFKGKPEMIEKALEVAEKVIPSALGHQVEEGQSTFVLDMSKNGSYEDAKFISAMEQEVANFFQAAMPETGTGVKADIHRLIRPSMRFFIAEGSVKCKLVRMMSPEQRVWAEGNDGKAILCKMGLIVIHALQYGYKLVSQASGEEISPLEISPEGVFYDLESDQPPRLEDIPTLLEHARADYITTVMFPGDFYAKEFCKDSDYFVAMREVSCPTFVKYLGCGAVSVQALGTGEDNDAERDEHNYMVALIDPTPSVLGILRGFHLAASGRTWVPLPPATPYSPAQIIFGGELCVSSLPTHAKIDLVKCVCGNGGELVGEDQLSQLFETKVHPVCYDGFEPSGRIHIAQGVLKAVNVNRLTKAGCVYVFWVADWFGLLNNKMGGDLDKIQTVGRYFVEVWKAAGMDMQNVRFLWAAEEINKNSDRYWLLVLNISRSFNITRIKRCSQIMGRQEGDEQPAASIMYPCMQCADVFYLGADICQLGLDQRKVNMLAREFLDRPECKEKREKPIIASHGMIPGLMGKEKMSKSDPDSAIFMEDDSDTVDRKVKKAFCPERQVEGNPCVEYVRMLVFPKDGQFVLRRSAEHGGDLVFTSPEEFENAYGTGDIHPADLKKNLADAINAMLEPVREHFRSDPRAARLLETVRGYSVKP